MAQAKDNYVLDLAASRRGYPINRLCESLRDEANRQRFRADEAAYCDEFRLSTEQKQAVLQREWTLMHELGASIFYTYKLAQLDKKSMQYLGGVFTGMSEEQFTAAMLSGGRRFG